MLLTLPFEADTQALGARLASALQRSQRGAFIALQGELGVGKTTLTRALITALGHRGPVVSPSYTLLEPYPLGERRLLHLDLYRIADPEELEYLGWREWDAEHDWVVVEWPENGAGFLPRADLNLQMEYAGEARRIALTSDTAAGKCLLQDLTQ